MILYTNLHEDESDIMINEIILNTFQIRNTSDL